MKQDTVCEIRFFSYAYLKNIQLNIQPTYFYGMLFVREQNKYFKLSIQFLTLFSLFVTDIRFYKHSVSVITGADTPISLGNFSDFIKNLYAYTHMSIDNL